VVLLQVGDRLVQLGVATDELGEQTAVLAPMMTAEGGAEAEAVEQQITTGRVWVAELRTGLLEIAERVPRQLQRGTETGVCR